jgi:hypothetical protein
LYHGLGYNNRIVTYGGVISEGTIFFHVDNLLYDLVDDSQKHLRGLSSSSSHTRLVVYSLKKLFAAQEQKPETVIKQIYAATAGVIFTGTLHHESDNWPSC